MRIGNAAWNQSQLDVMGEVLDLGLYAEQIEPDTGQHVGNFPQAFSHVGIINAAWCLGQIPSEGARMTA